MERNNPQFPEIGDLVDDGKYRIDSKIGVGAMGVVFAATHTILGHRVAIKWLLPELSEDETLVMRFLNEARIAAQIEHPNVIKPIDVSTKTEAPFIVMELLTGVSLKEYVKDRRLSIEEIGKILVPVFGGVAAAHAKGIIHRDLKLANIFLVKKADVITPKVLDFGIAKLMEMGETLTTLTQEGSTLGTILYMSPEQMKNPNKVTAQTDVYALGVIVYRLLSGKLPYEGNILDMVLRIHAGDAIPMTKHVDDISDDLNSVVMRAVSVNLDERYPDVATFASALAPFFSGGRRGSYQKTSLSVLKPLVDDNGRQDLTLSNPSAYDAIYRSKLISRPREQAKDPSSKSLVGPDKSISLPNPLFTESGNKHPTTTTPAQKSLIPFSIRATPRKLKKRWPLWGLLIAILIVAVVAMIRTVPWFYEYRSAAGGREKFQLPSTREKEQKEVAPNIGVRDSKAKAESHFNEQQQKGLADDWPEIPDDDISDVHNDAVTSTKQTETPYKETKHSQSTSSRKNSGHKESLIKDIFVPLRKGSHSKRESIKNKPKQANQYTIDDIGILDPF